VAGSNKPPLPEASIMTLAEVARYWRVHKSTISRLLKANELQGFKVGGRDWRFSRKALEQWVEPQEAQPGQTMITLYILLIAGVLIATILPGYEAQSNGSGRGNLKPRCGTCSRGTNHDHRPSSPAAAT
jgi:excisionase family DNA binding protein